MYMSTYLCIFEAYDPKHSHCPDMSRTYTRVRMMQASLALG